MGVLALPIYEYECTACGHPFELIQKFSDDPAKVCVRCGEPVNKLISRSAVHFKGTGWYATDYPKKGSAGSDGKSNGEVKKEEVKKESEKVSSESGGKGKEPSASSGASAPSTPTADKTSS